MQNNIYNKKNRNIYIFSPSGTVTGGVELLHQLCDVLNNKNNNAYIVYYGNKPHTIPNDYKKYNIKPLEASDTYDIDSNYIIVPETNLNLLNSFHNAKAIVWWMSVDNYFSALQANCFSTFIFHLRFGLLPYYNTALRTVIRKILHKKTYPTYTLKKLKNNKNVIFNAYQSEYANVFLQKHGINNTVHLSDYINEDYVFTPEVLRRKENIIIYNPKKGIRFTKKLIKAAPELKWIAIQNMTRSEVKETMEKAKLYIDFGHFPGKDRLPREAAMCGCCIITGKLGASGFKQDVPIEEQYYKFNTNKRNIKYIIKAIYNILNNYETEINNFSEYRKIIMNEKRFFLEDIENIF